MVEEKSLNVWIKVENLIRFAVSPLNTLKCFLYTSVSRFGKGIQMDFMEFWENPG